MFATTVTIVNAAGYELEPVVVTATFNGGAFTAPRVLTNSSVSVPLTSPAFFPIRVFVQPTNGESPGRETIDLNDTFGDARGNKYEAYFDRSKKELVVFNSPALKTSEKDTASLSIPENNVPLVFVNHAQQHVFDDTDLTWKTIPGPVCDFEVLDADGKVVQTVPGLQPTEKRVLVLPGFAEIRATLSNVNVDAQTKNVNLFLKNINAVTTTFQADNWPNAIGKKLQLAYYSRADAAAVTAYGDPSAAVVVAGFGPYSSFISSLGMPVGQQWSPMVILNVLDKPVTITVSQKKPQQATSFDPFARPKFVVQPGDKYPIVVYPGDTRLHVDIKTRASTTIPVPDNKYPYYTDDRMEFVVPGFEPNPVIVLDSKHNVFYMDIVTGDNAYKHVQTMSDSKQYKHRNVYEDVFETRVQPKLDATAASAPADVSSSAGPAKASSGLDGLQIAGITIGALAVAGIVGLGIAAAKETKALKNITNTI